MPTRAIIRNTPILILDEPSKTCIIVAHRLATNRRSDIIFVVQDGAIVEDGTHDALLKSGGLYSQLYELQYQTEEDMEKAAPIADSAP